MIDYYFALSVIAVVVVFIFVGLPIIGGIIGNPVNYSHSLRAGGSFVIVIAFIVALVILTVSSLNYILSS